jgi:hypothetical protein
MILLGEVSLVIEAKHGSADGRNNKKPKKSTVIYSKRAIISRGLYIVYLTFHCGLHCRAVSTSKQGNSSIF